MQADDRPAEHATVKGGLPALRLAPWVVVQAHGHDAKRAASRPVDDTNHIPAERLVPPERQPRHRTVRPLSLPLRAINNSEHEMSRTIILSTAVFAAIWAERRDGEETEDAILRRLLGCGDDAWANGGHDARNDVHFPEGFEIFRTYKRREYKATARAGVWLREDTGSGIRPSTGSTSPSRRVTKTCGTVAGNTARPTGRSGPSTRCAGRMEGNMQRPFGSGSVPRCGHAHSLPSSQAS